MHLILDSKVLQPVYKLTIPGEHLLLNADVYMPVHIHVQ